MNTVEINITLKTWEEQISKVDILKQTEGILGIHNKPSKVLCIGYFSCWDKTPDKMSVQGAHHQGEMHGS